MPDLCGNDGQMSKALDTSRKAVGGGGAKGRAGRGARQQLDFIVEGMRSGALNGGWRACVQRQETGGWSWPPS